MSVIPCQYYLSRIIPSKKNFNNRNQECQSFSRSCNLNHNDKMTSWISFKGSVYYLKVKIILACLHGLPQELKSLSNGDVTRDDLQQNF